MNIPLIYNGLGRIAGVDSVLVKSLETNGTFVPNPTHVIFSLKTTDKVPVKDKQGETKLVQAVNKDGSKMFRKDGTTPVMNVVYETVAIEPVLTTTVYFSDGTRVTVKNSKHDKIRLTKRKLADGTETDVADQCSLEAGVVYALAKRVMGKVVTDDNGNDVVGEGFTSALSKLVSEGTDQSYDDANAKAIKRVKKAEAKKAEAKDKKAEKPQSKNAVAKRSSRGKAKHAVRFKDMTQEQKRAYWRASNARRRQAKKSAK